MPDHFAIFHKKSGRQITHAHAEAADLVAEGDLHRVITRDKYGWPHLKAQYERRIAKGLDDAETD